MREIEKVLDANEQVFWENKPVFWPYFLTGAISEFVPGMFWIAIVGALTWLGLSIPDRSTLYYLGWSFFLVPFWLVGIWLVAGHHIYKILLFSRLHYAVTNKRVIIQKGVIGRDFVYIDFNKITHAEVRVGFWDKVFGGNSGSIIVSATGQYFLQNISDPYGVFKFFKKVSFDVKTDIEYPNALRSSENPGYNSRYNPNE